MFFSKLTAFSFIALALAAPLEKRAAITVSCDTGKASITPIAAVATTQGTGGADLADAAATITNQVFALVAKLENKDIVRRQAFTQNVAASMSAQFPTDNIVVANVGYTLSCTPLERFSTNYNAKLGSKVSFDVLAFGPGCTFILQGDGGFENWAYSVLSTCKINGKTLAC